MRGLKARFALSAVAATVAALATVMVLVGPGLRRRALEHQEQALLAEAHLVAHVVSGPLATTSAPAVLDPAVDAAAQGLRARVTLIGLDGRVLGDSALGGPALDAVENHGDRPEVVQALATGKGSAVRHSATIGRDLLYVAVPVVAGGRTLGVARVATPLSGVEEQAADLRRSVAAALGLALLLTAAVSALLAASMAGPLRDTMTAARRFAAGDLSARVPVRRRDELGELASILNQALGQLQGWHAEGVRDRARLDAVLAAMEEGVLAVDSSGTVMLANETVRRLLDWDPVGRTLVDAFRQREVSDLVAAVLETGRRQTREEVVWRRSGRVLNLVAVPFPGPSDVPGVLLTLHDVTENRRLERVRRDFVANASHELRTPLTSIRGFVEALEDGALQDPERGPRFLAKIRRHADQMTALVDDLLQLSSLEGGSRAPELEDVVVAEVVRDVLSSLEPSAARRAVRLALSGDPAVTVKTDPERLRRMVSNLVDNAIKYGREGGQVTVAVHQDGAGSTVEVADDGPGIAPEHLPRLFERFYRVDKARSREQGGTGLGLAIVRHMAASVGGRVEVESTPGRGTTFTVVLP